MPSNKPSRTLEMIEMPANFVPGPRHVICAKGKQAKEHSANQLLRSLIQQNLMEYQKCPSKLERSFIVSKILKFIRNGGEGGFVRNLNGRWSDIGDRNAREKIGQAFRDSLSHMFKSSTKAKACIRQRRSSDSEIVGSSFQITPVFPITEVNLRPTVSLGSTNAVTPAMVAQHDADMDNMNMMNMSTERELQLEDLEPLPLSRAITVDLSSMSQISIGSAPADSSFQEAMDEMYQSHFSSSSRSAYSV